MFPGHRRTRYGKVGQKSTRMHSMSLISLFFLTIFKNFLPGILKTTVPLVTFEDCGADSSLQFLCHNGDPKYPRFDRFDKWSHISRVT